MSGNLGQPNQQDYVYYDSTTQRPIAPTLSSGSVPVAVNGVVYSPYDKVGTLGTDETDAQGTSATTKTIPLGASVVQIDVVPAAASVAKYLWVVFNAASNAAATAALASPTARSRVSIGETEIWPFDSTDLCTRIDYRTDAGTCDVSLSWIVS